MQISFKVKMKAKQEFKPIGLMQVRNIRTITNKKENIPDNI